MTPNCCGTLAWIVIVVTVAASAVVLGQDRVSGENFSDPLSSGGQGPEMVVIPVGSFRMGCTGSYLGWACEEDHRGRFTSIKHDELPVHDVRFRSTFALSRFEITVAEWEACVSAGGCNGYRPEDPGFHRGNVRGRSPVVNVNWDDAQAYVRWLSEQTGHEYRLPSEAEWEYAARAGTTTIFPWGDEVGIGQANCEGDACGDGWMHTAPVGSFPPNPFGVYDMQGNVFEWVEDCWNDNYNGAPTDGTAWLSGDCTQSVWRGGSWFSGLGYLQTARRFGAPTGNRNNRIGFRVARTLGL